MIISFTNVIGAIRNAISSVITTNLKMWLGFETSETLGRELVDNGDFATDLSNWTIANNDSTHSVTYTSNGARFKSDTSSPVLTFTSDTANIISGRSYEIKVVISEYQGSNGIKIQNSATGNLNYLFDSVDTFTYNFTAVSDSSNPIKFYRNGTNVDITIESVSLKELTQFTPDKSGNNNVGELFTGKALDFDGAGDYVDVSGFSMSGNNATFAFWAYIRDNARADYFFDFQSSTTRFILGFGQASQKLAVYSGGWEDFGDPPQDQWVRIVLTVKGTTAKCFVDGVQLGTDKTISTYDFSSATTVHIGARYLPETNPKWYDGILSDFQVYNKAWLNEDIAYDYANPQNLVTDRDNTTIALSNLKAYWAMSEGAGSLTYDSSGEGNNGTIYGATYEPAQPRIPQLGMMNWSKGSNLYPFSEDFENSDWTKNAGTTITNNYATSPNGDLSAARYLGTGTSGVYDTFTLNTNSYTLSFYVKSNTGQNQNCRLIVDSVVSSNLLVTTDWTRISFTQNGSGQPGRTNGIFRDAGNNDIDILIWGAQLEESSSAGAYRLTDGEATSNSTVIPNPSIPTQDILGNAVRDRLNSFNLDGSGYAEVADDADLDFSGELTLETWVKADFNNVGSIFNAIYSINGSIAAATGLGFYTDSTKVYYRIGGATNSFTYTQGKWYYLAIIRDSSNNFKFYKGDDGIISEVASGNNTVDFTSTESKFIGKDATNDFSRYYSNLVDDTRAYDKGLSLTEIENNYNAGLSAHTND